MMVRGCGHAALLCVLLAFSYAHAVVSPVPPSSMSNNNDNNNNNNNNNNGRYSPLPSPSSPRLHISQQQPSPSPSPFPKSLHSNSSLISPSLGPASNTSNTSQIQVCLDCISFMQNNLNTLIEIVEKIGVTDTCAKLCGMLNNSVDIDACNIMCDAIGVQTFWQLFVKVDINPIYACELVNACVAGVSPAVNFTSTSITPSSGPPGTTFEFKMQFTVLNETGVGQTAFVVYFPNGGEYSIGFISQEIFPDYLPGDYQANLTFPTNSSFIAGKYLIIFDLCSGACGLDPQVYPFATEEVTFNITNIG